MNLLEESKRSCAVPDNKKPKHLIICTHAKFSAVELCKALREDDIEITFFPVDYSKEAANLDKLLELGVKVIEQPELLLAEIKKADAAVEDGARVSKLIQEYSITVKPNFFTVEQTSGGVKFLEEHPADYPVVNVAMSPMKLDIENRRATPEGVIRYFSEATGSLLGGKEVLILGFGSVGEGIARIAQTLGAHVTIYDTLATKRMFAKHHGYATVEQDQFDHLLSKIDVVFMATNTYQGSLMNAERILLMKDGTVICNAGSGRGELALDLQQLGTRKVHDAIVTICEYEGHMFLELTKGGMQKSITVLAKSFPINLHLGKGTSHDAIEVVMSLLLLAVLNGPDSKDPGLQPLSFEIQECVAQGFMRRSSPSRIFDPTFVHSRKLVIKERPYGGVFPFLNYTANMSIVRAWFKANSKTKGHYHRRSQESYYVEKGVADVIVWPASEPEKIQTFSMCPGDYLLVPENYFHDVRVTSDEDFECLVIATPPFVLWDQFFKEEDIT